MKPDAVIKFLNEDLEKTVKVDSDDLVKDFIWFFTRDGGIKKVSKDSGKYYWCVFIDEDENAKEIYPLFFETEEELKKAFATSLKDDVEVWQKSGFEITIKKLFIYE